ncbi:MAG TPA: bifunctional 2-polyprenyl-6-hydroxyphenol methylase/3-demethylubiquinol 3-O-methyltransferase UbiG [Alphaproteobacteria bacterium]|nr:bifunctional 2-polyprenyl-6-hydroxyphenol methylase/3-demethylubiquinol 3-O-methyltransferase UbiG [Alphaproteobacteria bacterium]
MTDAASPVTAANGTVDDAEIARFSAMAAEWWNPHGKFKPLHRFNPVRVGYLRDRIAGHYGRDPLSPKPLSNLKLLDVGCGGGLLAEPLTRLGAEVTGIDASGPGLMAAKLHAEQMGLGIDYRETTVEALAASGAQYDVVLNMEVIEHVADRPAFLSASVAALKPGGLMVVATLNRSAKAYALAIVGAEYILGWLPRGTHDWKKFVRPDELRAEMSGAGLTIEETMGVAYNPISDRWSLSRDTGVNYMISGVKPR